MASTRKKKLEVLSQYFQELVKVSKVNEYPTLFIGNKQITQGTEEVNKRIDVLIRENGLQWELN